MSIESTALAICATLDAAVGKTLKLKELRDRLAGDRSPDEWRAAVANAVAFCRGALAKDDKAVRLVGPIPRAGSAVAEEAEAGEAKTTCKDRRKARREALQIAAAAGGGGNGGGNGGPPAKAAKVSKVQDGPGDGYHLRESFVCAKCSKELPRDTFNKNQIKKGLGKHCCTPCVATATAAAAAAAAAAAEKSPSKKRKARPKEAIWAPGSGAAMPEAAAVAAAGGSARASALAAVPPAPPVLSLFRWRKAKALRSRFRKLLDRHGASRAPLLIFERWLARCRLFETVGLGDGGGAGSGGGGGVFAHVPGTVAAASIGDELLPSALWTDPGLVKDLVRASAVQRTKLHALCLVQRALFLTQSASKLCSVM